MAATSSRILRRVSQRIFQGRVLTACLHGRGITSASTRAAVGLAVAAGTSMGAAVIHESCIAQGEAGMGLDKGYAPRTTNPLAVIRKRPALPRVPGEPQYTTEQVSLHNRPGDMWVTYKDGVYNVSDFAQVSG